jgi:PAS domain S-box-containing protein
MEGSLIYLNDHFARMHGYEAGELVGKNLSIFHTTEQLPRVHEALELLRKHGEFSAMEIWRTKKDGSVFPSLMNAKVILDSRDNPAYMIANAIDITEIKHKEAEIKRLEIAIEQSPVALLMTDLDARITYVSPAFTAITGYTSEEAIGKKTNILKSGMNDPAIYDQLWETIQAGRIWKGELINRKKNGEFYYESISISPVIDHDGRITNYLAVKEDITTRKNIEDEKIARKAAEEANRAKSIFLSSMSHEIRTPLNAIIGFAQILEKDGELTSKQNEQVKTISRSGRHLLELINDILDLSKIEAGRINFDPHEFSLFELLDDLQAMFSVIAEKKGLRLLFEKMDDVPEYIITDEQKLRQVLINILGNAVKFTSVGNIVVRIHVENTGKDENLLCIEVQDTGPGIAKGDLKHIFDSFRQSDAGRKFGGTGLGLAISRKLLEVMGGWIRVDSTEGEGSEFQFRLPFIPTQTDASKGSLKDFRDIIGLDLAADEYRILVVDDGRDNRALLKALLEPIGFIVLEARDGKEALEVFLKNQIHLVLMDLRMPVMDGYEATKLLRAVDKGKDLPIIAVTASAFDDDEKVVLAKGFDNYIRKPFHLGELLEVIGAKLGLRCIYAEIPRTIGVHGEDRTISKDNLIPLPDELLQAMYAAIEQGNMVGFKDLLEQVEHYDPALANYLQELAKVYDYEKLLDLLKDEYL